MPLLLKEANGEYISWIDADDEYDKTFLEKMYSFVKENGLSTACCGTSCCRYEKLIIDKPERTAILEGRGFADNISFYYKYVTRLWTTLYSVRLLTPVMIPLKTIEGPTFFDAMVPLSIYKKQTGPEFFAESLH